MTVPGETILVSSRLTRPLAFGVFDLVADGNPQTGGDQLSQVAFQLVIGKAGHGSAVLTFVAR